MLPQYSLAIVQIKTSSFGLVLRTQRTLKVGIGELFVLNVVNSVLQVLYSNTVTYCTLLRVFAAASRSFSVSSSNIAFCSFQIDRRDT